MTKKFDPTKPVQTRDGRSARIVCTDMNGHTAYTILALVVDEHGKEEIRTFASDGRYWSSDTESSTDLVNIPEKVTKWINVVTDVFGHPYPGGLFHDSGEAALENAPHAIACVPVTFELP